MEIQRINSYDDVRFAKNVLYQHGGFLIDGKPCEVEIVKKEQAGELPLEEKNIRFFDDLL